MCVRVCVCVCVCECGGGLVVKITAHGNGLVIASPPSMVMKGLNDLTPHAPPWWLISCEALEHRNDTLAHQTLLCLTGTPLIAQFFLIVPHSVLVSVVLPLHHHVRKCAV